VPSVYRRQQLQVLIAGDGGLTVDGKRHQRVVLRGHQQSGQANAIQIALCGLGGVIILGGAKAKMRRGEEMVKLPYGLHLRQLGFRGCKAIRKFEHATSP
jgi:hypothetical protein